jgi:hypothetical protein
MGKKTSKKNEEKLKIYLSKVNDTKPSNNTNKNNNTRTQPGA